jgi:DNA segregation ATPase FtsK/SpoIIIE, S-DNA-T family
MKPWWRRALSGDVSLFGTTGRDRQRTNGSGTNGDHEDQIAIPTRDHAGTNGSKTAMPDRPVKPEVPWTDRDRKPLVPRSLEEPMATLRTAADHAWWVARFHLYRTHIYVGQNVLWAPRGLSRTITGLVRWARVHDKREAVWQAQDQAAETHNWGPYERLDRDRRTQARARSVGAVLGTAGTMVLLYVGTTNPWTVVPVLLAVLFGLGWLGRPQDRPYIESAVTTAPKARRITSDMITVALRAAKLCKETDKPDFLAPGVYRDGKGYGAVLDLPLGVTAKSAIKRQTDIAAGLRISERRLFIEQSTGPDGHASQIRLWIADTDPLAGPSVTSPLVKAPKFDLWQEIPFGQDEKGRLVSFLLLWTNVLIGALPRMGKTFVLRLIVAAAALDPYVKLLLWDGKGGKDHSPFERVCHAFGAGASDKVAKALLKTATDLVRDMDERYEKLSTVPDERCPEGKLTLALARDRDLDMPVTLLAIDEFQVYLQNEMYGAKILKALTVLAQRGSGAGIILALATQRPSSKVMNTDFRDLFGTRVALRMITDEASEMILGSGSSRAGLNSAKFRATDKGVCILLGADDGALVDRGGQTVKAHLMDLPAATAVANRARALREGAGTLSGVAAGEKPEDLSDEVLSHVAAAFEGEEKAHSEVLVARMAAMYPGLYETYDQNDLAAALGRHEIPAGNDIWAVPLEGGAKRNREGFHLKQILDKLAEKAGEVPDFPPDDLD